MKELSTEEKAKRYDEAVAIAKECITHIPDEAVNKYMLNMFPELYESEDERIRKAIYNALKYLETELSWDFLGDVDILAAYDWLEKQTDKPQGKSALESWKDMRFEVYQQASGNRHESNYSDDATKVFSLNDIDEIFEKIAESYEEKSADNVEPKSSWKPTEKQINAIRLARSFVTDDFSDNPTLSEILTELEEQLRNL